jgi:hypothetical protein
MVSVCSTREYENGMKYIGPFCFLCLIYANFFWHRNKVISINENIKCVRPIYIKLIIISITLPFLYFFIKQYVSVVSILGFCKSFLINEFRVLSREWTSKELSILDLNRCNKWHWKLKFYCACLWRKSKSCQYWLTVSIIYFFFFLSQSMFLYFSRLSVLLIQAHLV